MVGTEAEGDSVNRLVWKVFTIVTGVVYSLPLLFGTSSGQVETSTRFTLPLEAIDVLGLIGFSWHVRIGWRWLWKVVFVAHVVVLVILTPFSIYISLLTPLPEVAAWVWRLFMTLGGVFLVLWFLQLYALFRYAFREDQLWNRPAAI